MLHLMSKRSSKWEKYYTNNNDMELHVRLYYDGSKPENAFRPPTKVASFELFWKDQVFFFDNNPDNFDPSSHGIGRGYYKKKAKYNMHSVEPIMDKFDKGAWLLSFLEESKNAGMPQFIVEFVARTINKAAFLGVAGQIAIGILEGILRFYGLH